MGELTILLVDDEEVLLSSLEKFFIRKGFNVISSTRVNGAIELIRNHPIQILITDMRLPDGTGLSVIKSYKERYPQGLVLCVTGFSEEDETSILKAGADVIIGKPFEKKALLNTILERLA